MLDAFESLRLARGRRRGGAAKAIRRHYWMYLMLAPGLLYFLCFHYLPMLGVVVAFKRFNAFTGILDSPWVGLKHFETFFNSIYVTRLFGNTLILNLYALVIGFPIPIIFALLLNEVTRTVFRRFVQTVSYLPYFISTTIVASLIISFLDKDAGPVNYVLGTAGLERIEFLIRPEWFRHIYVWSDIWQYTGWTAVIYLGALTAIDPTLYEAAEIDGAGRFARMRHVSIPGILPVIMVMLLLSLGSLLSIGFEKVFLLQNTRTYETADVISTYVYRAGLQGGRYDFGTAVGLFNSVVSFVLLVLFNWIAGRLKQQTLW